MPLLNSFINAIVCVGFNSERGLIIDRKSDDSNSPFLSFLQPYVLAILTSDQAVYPQSKKGEIFDLSYPPIPNSNPISPKNRLKPNVFDTLPIFCSPDGVKMSHKQEESRIHHIVFTQEEGTRSYAVVLTFQQKFTLKTDKPDDDGIYQIESPTHQPKHHAKRITSSYRYGNSSNSTLPHNTNGITRKEHQDEQSSSSLRSSDSSSRNGTSRMRERSNSITSLNSLSNRKSNGITYDASEPFYIPHCVVLVSSHPYWTAMQELISIIHNDILQHNIEPDSNSYKSLIQKYAFFACNTPVPPIAWERFSLSLFLKYDQTVLTFDPPLHTNRTVLDLDLSTLLLTLNIGKLLNVLAAIFTQQPIIFFSTDYSKLVTTLECLLYLIYPLKWIHTYIPILPDSLRDYIEGPPGSYIMGVHTRHQLTVENLDLSLTCNLDNDKNIHIPSTVVFHPIPSTKLRRFIGPITEFIEHIKTTRSLQNVHSPICLRLDKQRESERQHRLQTNEKIIEIFLDLMVDLFEDTLKPIYRTIDHQHRGSTSSLTQLATTEKTNSTRNQTKFSKENYLLSKTEGDEKEFYRLFIATTAFELFIEDEMASETYTEFQRICQLRTQSNQDQSFRSYRTLSATSSGSLFDTTHDKILLPEWSFDASKHYLDICIELFTTELEDAQRQHSTPLTTVFAYLLGCALLARGHLLDGLDYLYLIENRNLFPKTYIEKTIVPLLTDAYLLNIFLHETFYLKSPKWKRIQTDGTDGTMLTISFGRSTELVDHNIPSELLTKILTKTEYDIIEKISFEQFNDDVHQLRVVSDRETAEILFKALLHWIDIPIKPIETQKLSRRWSVSSGNVTIDVNNHQRDIVSTKSTLLVKLFQLFLKTWRETNAGNEQMNSVLPKEQQKQESILMVSSSNISSKKDKEGKLILTQRGIYFLPEGRSSAHLLTELLKIVYIEDYTHKLTFSSKPAIRIYAFHSSSSTLQQDSEPTAILTFKDHHEQKFWYKIISELWWGVSIAQEQCDTTVLHKISEHITLIDTILKIDYNEAILPKKAAAKSKSNHTQANLDAVLNVFTIFTRMQKSGTLKTLTDATRKALYNRLSPSINETERHVVRCLIFIENSEDDYPFVWCAYGPKLKLFNTITWTCDPSQLCFPSLITCMCLDSYEILWVGCMDGQLFVVDTKQRICGTQLALIEGKGGCQAMTFDTTRDQMLIATQSGLIIIWDVINKQRLNDINLEEIFKQTSNNTHGLLFPNVASSTETNGVVSTSPNKLKSIQIYANRLFACYRDDEIRIFAITDSNTYIYEDRISVKYKIESSMPINSFLIYNQQLWISASYIIYIYSINHENRRNSYKLIMKKHLDDDHLLTMLGFSDHIWAGSARGNVYVYRMDNYELSKTFDGHKDGVCCLCPMLDKYVISGSQQGDTSIVIWENAQTSGSLNATRM